MSYASNTTVTVEESRAELRRLLERTGATQIAIGKNPSGGDVVLFTHRGRNIRFKMDPSHQEQAHRSQWRTLVLMFKAKLAAVDAGLVPFEQEFLAHVGLPSGSTVGRMMAPAIEHAYRTGEQPRLLAHGGSR